MITLPSKFKSLEIDWYAYGVNNNDTVTTFYLKDDEGKTTEINTHDSIRETEECRVVSVGEEVNGFRRVEFSNGKIGFQDASGKVAPYKFNIASDFNEYGFAIVGTMYGVTWINSEFKKLTARGTWTFMEDQFIEMPTRIQNFVLGMSSVSYMRRSKREAFFIDIEGKKVQFVDELHEQYVDFGGTYDSEAGFNELGYKITSKGVYFANGSFMGFEEIIKLPEASELLGKISRNKLEQLETDKKMALLPNSKRKENIES